MVLFVLRSADLLAYGNRWGGVGNEGLRRLVWYANLLTRRERGKYKRNRARERERNEKSETEEKPNEQKETRERQNARTATQQKNGETNISSKGETRREIKRCAEPTKDTARRQDNLPGEASRSAAGRPRNWKYKRNRTRGGNSSANRTRDREIRGRV